MTEAPREPLSGLAREIQQNRSFESMESEAYLNVLRTASMLQNRVSSSMRAFGVSHPQYNVLRILRGAGEQGLRCGEVAERMITRVPDISRLLDRLHRKGWIERQRDAEDRRVVRMTISVDGVDLLERMNEPLQALVPALLSDLNQGDLVELSRLLVLARSRA
jgi:DNA-binding MarR family transcriptional regulator